jgi:hypothetical protein
VEHSNFYQHEDNRGDRLELRASTGAISDLTEEHLGGLFSGHDWNDKISAVELVRTQVVVLWEHTGFAGQSLTLTGNARALWPFGWNDRASSVQTWGSTPWTEVGWICGMDG